MKLLWSSINGKIISKTEPKLDFNQKLGENIIEDNGEKLIINNYKVENDIIIQIKSFSFDGFMITKIIDCYQK